MLIVIPKLTVIKIFPSNNNRIISKKKDFSPNATDLPSKI